PVVESFDGSHDRSLVRVGDADTVQHPRHGRDGHFGQSRNLSDGRHTPPETDYSSGKAAASAGTGYRRSCDGDCTRCRRVRQSSKPFVKTTKRVAYQAPAHAPEALPDPCSNVLLDAQSGVRIVHAACRLSRSPLSTYLSVGLEQTGTRR